MNPRRGCWASRPSALQVQQRLAHRRDADAQFDRQLIEPHVLPRAIGAVEDAPADVARDVVGQLRPGRELRSVIGQIRYSASRLLLMIVFWISLVPSPISRNGASRINRSISYSLE